MNSLQDYLQQLNSAESQWGIWVNPENPTEEYRIGQYCFENGGMADSWVCVGSLENLSFGFQSTYDAIKQFIEDSDDAVVYNGKVVKVNAKGILEAYSSGLLDEDFQEFLESEAAKIEAIWAEEESWDFVHNKMPDILEEVQKKQEIYA